MAVLLGTVEARLRPERNMVMVIGTGFRDLFLPDFTEGRLCYGGPDLLYLMSDGRTGHDEHVTLESWDARPEPPPAGLTATAVVTLSRPGIYVSRMTESAASPVLELPAAGNYVAHVAVTGHHIRVQLVPRATVDRRE